MGCSNFARLIGLIFCSFVFANQYAVAQGGQRQGAPEFVAIAESPEVAVGTAFEVTFQLKNAEGRQFRPPTFNGFKKLAGPSTQSSMTIVNGRYSQSMAWQYILQAVQPGSFTIGEASVEANGQLLRTQPIKIDVTASRGNSGNGPKVNATPGPGGNDDLFVAAELSHDKVWIGQQVVLNYVIYTRVGVESYDILQEPGYEGFFAKDMSRFDTRTRTVSVRGKQYTARILKSVALFPQKTGTLAIAPMRFQFGVPMPGAAQDPFSRFFGRAVQPVAVESQPASLRVESLPEPAPERFSGGVGRYVWQAEIDKNTLSTDDAVSLRLSLKGNGDGKRFALPKINLPPELEAYDPKIVEEETYENGEELVHAQIVEIAILPRQPGTYDIRPELVVFDPDSARYVVKRVANPLTINVSQGKSGGAAALKKEGSEGDISPLRTETQLRPPGDFLYFSPLFWLLLALPALALGGLFFWKKQQAQRADAVAASPGLQAKKQTEAAHAQLVRARSLQQAGKAQEFFDEIEHALHTWLSARLGMPVSALTKNLIREKLTEKGASAAQLASLDQVLMACEFARFAGQADAGRMESVYRLAEETLRGLEQNI